MSSLPSQELLNWFTSQYSAPGKPVKYPQLKNLSVIIPSYQRQDFILRQLLFWKDSGVCLYILDGSSEDLSIHLKSVVLDANVFYLHLPIDLPKRLNYVAELIQTSYTVSIADDEFHLKSGLVYALAKLDADQELAACIGQSLEIYLDSRSNKITYGKGYAHKKFNVLSNNVSERLHYAFSNYNAATAYAVLRSNVWRNSWGNTFKTSSPYAIEIQQGISVYCAGKFASSDKIYWLRSNEAPPVTILDDFDRKISFRKWWTLPAFQNEREVFIEKLASQLVKQDIDLSFEKAKDTILSAIDSYLIFEMNYSYNKNTTVQKVLFHITRQMKLILSEKRYQSLRALFRKLSSTNNHEGEWGTIAAFQDKGLRKTLDIDDEILNEMREVDALIIDYYRHRNYKLLS